MLEIFIVVLIVVSGSAICSGSETALLSVSRIRVRQLAQTKKPAAQALLAIRQKINRPIATIVIINNVFNIVGSIVIGSLAAQVLGDAGLGIFSGVLTFLIIVFGEIVPKTLAERYAESIALAIALPVRFLTILLTPLVWLMEKVTAPLIKGQRLPTTNEAEIQLLTKIGFQEGVIEDDEADMIVRVFQLNDLTAAELMTPRVIITHIRGQLTLAEGKSKIIASQHTRILVSEDSIDQVLGIALKHELLTAIIQGQQTQQIATLTRPARFVPETVRADKLLKAFQETREHLMVVLDEYGGVSGVITLEDVLEVITGEIVDETDRSIDLQAIARKKRERLLKSRGLQVS
ncbi:MAG: hemolysin family protein [Cyanophyceae cyanobacterium]